MDENQNNENNMEGAPQEGSGAPQFTPQPEPAPATMPEPPTSEKSYGPLVGIIVIVIILILAGFYFWGGSLADRAEEAPLQDNTEEVSKTTEVGAPLSESDEIGDLEAELNGTDLDNLDAELEDIDAELNF